MQSNSCPSTVTRELPAGVRCRDGETLPIARLIRVKPTATTEGLTAAIQMLRTVLAREVRRA